MKPACEIITLEVLPAFRAIVAKKLLDEYGLSQKQAAEKMGTTQPAISQYKRNVRGCRTGILSENPKIMAMIERIAKQLAGGEITSQDSILGFCEICKHMKFSGLACEMHRVQNPDLGTCAVCMENREFYGGRDNRIKKKKLQKKDMKTMSLVKFQK
jgi:predicted transcriptional regulator